MNNRLLQKFFNKECTPEEAIQVMEWFQIQEVPKRHEEDLYSIWEEVEKETQDVGFSHDPEELLKVIHQQIKTKTRSERNVGRNVPSKSIASYVLKGAAVLFVFCLFGWFLKDKVSNVPKEEPAELIVLEAPIGTKLTKVLPDGSKVILNSNSSITYMDGFSEKKREITLSGEGYFEVAKDSSRPFTVHAGKISTTALGTSFNIKYHPYDTTTEVSLATGKIIVKIEDKNGVRSTNLHPGEMAYNTSSGDSLIVDQFDLSETLAWKDGVIYFKETNLDQMVQQLENWYGVQITLEGNPKKIKNASWTYTGRFENQSLENVLIGIAFVKDFNFKIDGKNIKLIF